MLQFIMVPGLYWFYVPLGLSLWAGFHTGTRLLAKAIVRNQVPPQGGSRGIFIVSSFIANSLLACTTLFIPYPFFGVFVAGMAGTGVLSLWSALDRRYSLVAFVASKLRVPSFFKKVAPGLYSKLRYIRFLLWVRTAFDWLLFATVTAAVYVVLTRREKKKAPKLESLMSDLEAEGLNSAAMLRLLAVGLKIGAVAAALADLGTNLLPKDMYISSLIADCLKLFSETIPKKEKKDDDDDDDDDEIAVVSHLVQIRNKIVQVFKKHRVRIGVFAFASVCGVCLYLVIHRRRLLGIDTKKDKQIEYRSLVKLEDLEASLPLEEKGKNKKMRARRSRSAKKVRNDYIIYDEDDIIDLYVDGVPVSKRDYVGRALPKGHYTVVRDHGGGRYAEEDFTIGDDLESELSGCANDWSGPVNTLVQVLPSKTVEPQAQVVVTPKSVSFGTFEEKVFVEVPTKVEEPKILVPAVSIPKPVKVTEKEPTSVFKYLEALVPTSPLYKVSVVRQCVGKVLDDKQVPYLNCISTFAGLITNVHGLDRAHYVEFNGSKFSIREKGELIAHVKGQFGHPDLALLRRIDGPPILKKMNFTVADIGQDFALVTAAGDVSQGKVTGKEAVTVLGPGNDLVVSSSSEGGWCGSPYVDSNGKIIGIHYARGEKDKNNRAIAVSEEFLRIFDNPGKIFPKN